MNMREYDAKAVIIACAQQQTRQELSYRQQIARQVRTQYAEGISINITP